MNPQRIEGVSAFGFGGINFHAILASHGTTSPAPALTDWPAELFVVRGAEHADAVQVLDLLETATMAEVQPKLRDLAASINAANRTHPARFAIVASSMADLGTKVEAARADRAASGVHIVEPYGKVSGRSGSPPADGQVAFLFPGQGSQRPDMLGDLFVTFPS